MDSQKITEDQLGFAEKTDDTNQNDERVLDGDDEEVKGNFDADKESDQDKYEDFDPMVSVEHDFKISIN